MAKTRQTSWLFTRVTEELNSGPTRTTPACGQNRPLIPIPSRPYPTPGIVFFFQKDGKFPRVGTNKWVHYPRVRTKKKANAPSPGHDTAKIFMNRK